MKSFLATCLVAILVIVPVHANGKSHGQPPAGAAAQGKNLVTVCTACHGGNGIATTPSYPNLAGQKYGYILKQLQDFKDGKRVSSIMSGMAMTIPASSGDRNLDDIAAYFHLMKPMWAASSHAGTSSDAQHLLGKALFTRGEHADRIPACAACHGLAGEGNGPMAVPSLAGQHAAYIVAQLQKFARGKRKNSTGHVMYVIARKLTSKQMSAVAAYVEELNPDTTLGIGPKDFVKYTRALHARHAGRDAGTSKSAPAPASSSHE
ncbi:c-type cytochrome [Oleiagrimonas sp.]|jgi:cytochrome c553|uniref:c-type cytochrome n=1 Tax=Oleiagrimonas sp. TaxID=2010330 RepID=UPI00261F0860|nr:c-type cytochrome [Oleiagrimonas sp.]MDA3914877.1 c-type cytochrome [Oleiagrimonas sp.]